MVAGWLLATARRPPTGGRALASDRSSSGRLTCPRSDRRAGSRAAAMGRRARAPDGHAARFRLPQAAEIHDEAGQRPCDQRGGARGRPEGGGGRVTSTTSYAASVTDSLLPANTVSASTAATASAPTVGTTRARVPWPARSRHTGDGRGRRRRAQEQRERVIGAERLNRPVDGAARRPPAPGAGRAGRRGRRAAGGSAGPRWRQSSAGTSSAREPGGAEPARQRAVARRRGAGGQRAARAAPSW